jgi:hypothetical protein
MSARRASLFGSGDAALKTSCGDGTRGLKNIVDIESSGLARTGTLIGSEVLCPKNKNF